ncbi:MAG: MYXO-CTERM sorting domain-containing protein [Polyangiaceae bacterium]
MLGRFPVRFSDTSRRFGHIRASSLWATLLTVAVLLVSASALADEPPPEPAKKDGGCGCETTGYPRTYTALSVAFMGVGLVLFRRSTRRSKRER